MFDFIINKILPKGKILPCDENSCMCDTKDCVFWKILDKQKLENVE